jgi:hypothetical protein
VFDLYEDAVERYRADLQAWEKRRARGPEKEKRRRASS